MNPQNTPKEELQPFEPVNLNERLDEILPFPDAPDIEERLADILKFSPTLPPDIAKPTAIWKVQQNKVFETCTIYKKD